MNGRWVRRCSRLPRPARGTLVAELAPLMAKHGGGAIVNLTTVVASYGRPACRCTRRARPPSSC
jgi:hypothetical protein